MILKIKTRCFNYKILFVFFVEKGESVLPIGFQSRLHDLFSQIEKEFEALYVENLAREFNNVKIAYLIKICMNKL